MFGRMVGRRRARGFTLFEVITVLGILGIVLLVALPNLHNMLVRIRLGGAVRDVERLASAARYQAVNASRQAFLVFLRSSGSYPEFAAYRLAGRDAVVVFLDVNGSGGFDAGDRLADQYPLPRTIAFRRPGTASPLPSDRVIFRASGEVAATTNIEIYFGDELGNFMRLTMMPTGLTRRQKNVPGHENEWWGTDREGQWRWIY